MQVHLTIRQTRQYTCMSKSHVSVQIQQLWILYCHLLSFALSLSPFPCHIMYLSLCDWPQQMNKAFIPTSPPRSLCASNQNMPHCHQSGTQRERDLTPRLYNPSWAGHTTSNTLGVDNVQVNGQWRSMRCTAECQDVSQWKVCCGQTQICQDICQDVGPFCSRLAAVALQMLI